MADTCPICSSKGKQIRDNVKGGVSVNVYRCDECYLDFLETWDDEKRVYSFYDRDNYVFKPNVTGEKMKYNEYEGRFKRVFPFLKQDTKLLDIGCGDGTFLRMVRPHVAVAEGTEITTYHVNNLRKEGVKIWDCFLHEMTPEGPYDIICLFALLEHVPKVMKFLNDLKSRFTHEKTQIFIEVPNLLDPLTSCYDVREYRDFFYREYHLYYFSEKSLNKLINKAGFNCQTEPLLQASLTNHFHWMHEGKGQATTTDMSNVVLPRAALMDKTPAGNAFMDILDKVDDFYRELLLKEGIGDLLACRAWL
ncbi:MAG: class I SAM-dependent methyltransferase [Deltaproteobacteria bacterium]|nr:class I SAM-dependent methyltransferase [Deltaproteobacteria bacterium]